MDPVPGSVQVPVSGSFAVTRALHQIDNPADPPDGLPASLTFGYVRFVDITGKPMPVTDASIELHPILSLIDFVPDPQDNSLWRLRFWKGSSGAAYPARLRVAGGPTSDLTLMISNAVSETPHIAINVIGAAGQFYRLIGFVGGLNVGVVGVGNL